MCFIILIDISGFSKFSVEEEKYVDNCILVNFIFMEKKDDPHLERYLKTMAQNISITKRNLLIIKAGNTKIINSRRNC